LIAFYVQGGGLGHLSRTAAVLEYLKIPVGKVLLITPSNFAHYFKQYTTVSLAWEDPPKVWADHIEHLLTENHISECYVDAFPLGLKGELIPVYKALPKVAFTYTCRILKCLGETSLKKRQLHLA